MLFLTEWDHPYINTMPDMTRETDDMPYDTQV